jgi:hypothetical protein
MILVGRLCLSDLLAVALKDLPRGGSSQLGAQLVRLANKRLKVGDIKADNGTITADIVTVDNSLVQRLKVDRHTGSIEYEN